MTLSYTFDYLNCQSCTEKTHCSTCAAEIRETLLGADGVSAADVRIPGYTLIVEGDIDADDIEELLEDNAVFV